MTKAVTTEQDVPTLWCHDSAKVGMANTRRSSFRLGKETERKLDELAQETGSSRTEVVRALILARHRKKHPNEKPKRGEPDPSQMILDEFLYSEVGEDL